MNHDYAHCLDFTDDCPEKCFRAQLIRDMSLRHEIYIPLTLAHFKGTDECKRKETKNA